MLLIPAIDLRGSRCVRLYQGDYAAETRYDVEPLELFDHYLQMGASWLHVVDLDGARDGAQANRAAILELAARKALKLQVGGGVREAATIETLLNAGVSRVVIGSAAVTNRDATLAWLKQFGPEAITLAFDVRINEKGVPQCATHGWREQSILDLWQAIENYLDAGLKHVLCTDIARDGALNGPNIELYREAMQRYPEIQWQASGGVCGAIDLHALAAMKVSAAISGRALLEKRLNPLELRPFLPNALSPA